MSDLKTIEAYNKNAEDYHTRFHITEPNKALKMFMNSLPTGGRVLDLGCGPGHWSLLMQNAGFEIDATDASEEMVKIAKEECGVRARQATFDEISDKNTYDGVWANFSLLHANREDFPRHLAAIYQALKPGGAFHIGMKLGTDAKRDRLDRFYTFYEEDDLKKHLTTSGFNILNVKTGEEVGLACTKDAFALILAEKPEN
ncbi:MAG: class I SAM-dependent methyltransferase [Rhizobiaceae bacterium]|nr:class I SAM-dependent methyltransferase [Rhizobiaceae bacterium]